MSLDVPFPDLPRVRFGRLALYGDVVANDIVIVLPDPRSALQIAKRAFDVENTGSGYLLHNIPAAPMRLNRVEVLKGKPRKLRPGSTLWVGSVLTVDFVGESRDEV